MTLSPFSMEGGFFGSIYKKIMIFNYDPIIQTSNVYGAVDDNLGQ
jgi:hypothetical protein